MIEILAQILGAIAALFAILKAITSAIKWMKSRSNKKTYRKSFRKKNSTFVSFGMLTPDDFFGRNEDIAKLRRILLDEESRCIALHAMPGCGKSSLVSVLIDGISNTVENSNDLLIAYKEGLRNKFDSILWWRLTDAPSLEELSKELITLVTGDYPSSMPRDAEHLTYRVIEATKRKRVLLVLDNLETLLTPSKSGKIWREGYENYRIFLRQICETETGISVIITTREVPSILYNQKRLNHRVHIIQVEGLKIEAFKKIISHHGELVSSKNTWEWLRERYSGNPLAAKILSNYIHDIYNGNVDEFRTHEPKVLPEFNELLEFHFNRLDGFEKEIAYWLAINREPVSIDTLKDDLLYYQSKDRVSMSLKKLGSRIPIESKNNYFGLQPVLLDFITFRICSKVGDLFGCSTAEISNYISLLLTNDIFKEFQNGEFGLLDRVALLKAFTPEHIRQSQRFSVVLPLLKRLNQFAGSNDGTQEMLYKVLNEFQQRSESRRSYIGTNITTLLLTMNGQLNRENFSNLVFIHPYFVGAEIRNTNFSNCTFIKPSFTERFGAGLAIDSSPCGRYIVVGDTLGTIRVWDLRSGLTLFSKLQHKNWVRTVKYLDHEKIVSAGNDGDIFINCSKTGALLNTIKKAHDGWINSIIPYQNGFFSISEDGKVKSWSNSYKLNWSKNLNRLLFDCIIDVNQNNLLVAAANGYVFVLKLRNGKIINKNKLHQTDVQCLSINETGNKCASGDSSGIVTVWDIERMKIVYKFDSKTLFVRAILFVGKNTILIGGDDSNIRAFDLENLPATVKIYRGHFSSVRGLITLNNNGSFVSVSEDKTIKHWDAKSGIVLDQSVGFSATVWSSHQTIDKMLVAGCETGEIIIWSKKKAENRKIYKLHRGRIFSVRAHPSLPLVAFGGTEGVIRIIDIHNGKIVSKLVGHQDWIKRIRFSEDGELLFSCSEDKTVFCWNWRKSNIIWKNKDSTSRVTALCLNNSRNRIYSGDENGVITEINLTTGSKFRFFKGHVGKVRSLAIAPNRRKLFSSGEDGKIRVWKLDRPCEPLDIYDISESQLWSLDYVPEYECLIGGDNSGNLFKISIKNGEILQQRKAHDGAIWDIQTDVTGKVVCSASGDEMTAIWDPCNCTPLHKESAPKPYEKSTFQEVSGLSETQKLNLKMLGASA